MKRGAAGCNGKSGNPPLPAGREVGVDVINGVRSRRNVEVEIRRICKQTCWSRARLGRCHGECDTVLRQAWEIQI